MRKSILVLGLIATLISCSDKSKETTTTSNEIKTAYIDTQKLMKEYEETKDLESKYKIKSEQMGKELEAEIKKFQNEAQNFEKNAQAKGMEWAQKKAAELQRREQELGMKQQTMMQTLQMESGQEMDSVVKKIKSHVKEFGEKNGYDYIYGTDDVSTVFYAKEKYDLTEQIVTDLNSKYKSTSAPKEEVKKEEVKKEEEKK